MEISLDISKIRSTSDLEDVSAACDSLPRSEVLAPELFTVAGELSVALLDILQLPLPHSIETLSVTPEGIFYGVEEEFPLPDGFQGPLVQIGLFAAPAGTLGGSPVFALTEQTLCDGLARWVSLNNGSSYLLHSYHQMLCLKGGS
jgi:hypothetical protein